MIHKFIKKPMLIEAMQLEKSKESFEEAYEWMGLNVELSYATDGTFINIKTLEGVMRANIGDYIVKGINGEFYPVKEEIFKKIYEVI